MKRVLLVVMLVVVVAMWAQDAVETISSSRSRNADIWNPMHVGDKWWFEYEDGMTSDICMGRQVLADTLINGEAWFSIWGIASWEDYWITNRGDSTFILDTGDWDNNPETNELLFFDWSLDEPGDTCWVYHHHAFCSDWIVPTRVELSDIYTGTGFLGEDITVRSYWLYSTYEGVLDWPWTQSWKTNYGLCHNCVEMGHVWLRACEVDGVFYGDPSVDIAEEEQPPSPDITLRCSPNPCRGEARIAYSLGGEHARGELSIFNIRGQLVRQAHIAGAGDFTWNGLDARGRAVPSGVYLCRIVDATGNTTASKLMLLR